MISFEKWNEAQIPSAPPPPGRLGEIGQKVAAISLIVKQMYNYIGTIPATADPNRQLLPLRKSINDLNADVYNLMNLVKTKGY